MMLCALLPLVRQEGVAQARGAWSSRFSNNGPDGKVYAIVLDEDGRVYIGGSFSEAGGVSANNIARWTGTEWEALGEGFNGPVYTLAFGLNGELYAGGEFTASGGVTIPRLARWSGATWEGLAESMSISDLGIPSVEALAVDPDGLLYAGGTFSGINGLESQGIAAWDGQGWHGLDGGVDGPGLLDLALDDVYSLATGDDGAIYVGGSFQEAGGQPAGGIARWTGNAWEALGTGIGGSYYSAVYSVAIYEDQIYIGGNFDEADGNAAPRIARWTGTSWEAVESNTGDTILGDVIAMTPGPSGLYVGTNLFSIDGRGTGGIALWTGENWQQLGEGLNVGAVTFAIAIDRSQVYVGGSKLTEAGGWPASGIALWEDAGPTSREESPEHPDRFDIEPAFPNPFTEATTVTFTVSSEAREALRLELYDVLGRRVATLSEGRYPPGQHKVRWSRDDLPAGVYVLRLQAGQVICTEMLVVSP